MNTFNSQLTTVSEKALKAVKLKTLWSISRDRSYKTTNGPRDRDYKVSNGL